MVDNEEFYKEVLHAQNVLEHFYFFEAMANDDLRNEYARYGYERFSESRTALEKSCDLHIPVILGINKNSKVFDHSTGKFVPMKIQRCLCCGKLLPFELENGLEINCINYIENEDNSIIDYNELNRKYFKLLEEYVNIARYCTNKKEAVKQFREMINTDYRTLKRPIKK